MKKTIQLLYITLLIFFSVSCAAQETDASNGKMRKVSCGDYKITFDANGHFKVPIIDSTGEQIGDTSIKRDPFPSKLNDEEIYETPDRKARFIEADLIERFLLKKMSNEIFKLSDGIYSFGMNDILIDKEGKIDYYTYRDLSGVHFGIPDETHGEDEIQINDSVVNCFFTKTKELLCKVVVFNPATTKSGKKVNCLIADYGIWFKVKGHKIFLSDKQYQYTIPL